MYLIGLQDALWLVPQWLSHIREAKNPVVLQFTDTEVSAVPIWCQGLEASQRTGTLQSTLVSVKECFSNRTDELARESAGEQSKANLPASYPCVGCHQKVQPTSQAGLLTSSSLIQKIPHLRAPQIVFEMVPAAVKWQPRLATRAGDIVCLF